MTNDQLWKKINSWRKKYSDYENDYWVLSQAKNNLSESINGLDTLYNSHYNNIKDVLETALGKQSNLKNSLKLTKSNLNIVVKDNHDDIQNAMNLLLEAMETAQSKINYYYGQLD